LNTDIHAILKQYWGYESFRPLQEDIINSSLNGEDTLALLPTGGGKSICFQVPVLAQKGIGVVISPLIALMQDQVQNLQKRNINAVAITSGLSQHEIDIALENCVQGHYKFLYLSPERIQMDLVQERLKRMRINLIAVDEAHCISQWGYDFRPAYLEIKTLRKLLPNIPVLALTATATPKVAADIQEKLCFKKAHLLQKSFHRSNLVYSVVATEQKWRKCLQALQKSQGTAIIYARNRKGTVEIAQWLQQYQFSADYYHAGLSPEARSDKLEKWLQNKIRIMVCTNAFGMGIDKPDVRLVLHLELPDSLEAYFQEAGRAGRDEEEAHALLLLSPDDVGRLKHRYLESFPSEADVKHVYQCLANHLQLAVGGSAGRQFPFSLQAFCKKYGLHHFKTLQALKILEKEALIALSEATYQNARLFVKVNRTQLYDFQLRNPKLDDFIKLLMRSYGGLSTEFTPINEELLALRMKSNPEKVKELLHFLDKQNIVSYQPKQDKAMLTLLKDRMDPDNLRIADVFLKDRFTDLKQRIEAVVHFVEQTDSCRSRVLLAYFGEEAQGDCGRCDVCRKRASTNLTNAQKRVLKEQFLALVESSPGIALYALAEQLHQPEDQLLVFMRTLVDEGCVVLRENKLYKS
jgi:ATP-dependent DNA helicase RecQ